MEICRKCGELADWSYHFQGYSCSTCGHVEPKKHECPCCKSTDTEEVKAVKCNKCKVITEV